MKRNLVEYVEPNLIYAFSIYFIHSLLYLNLRILLFNVVRLF